MARPPAATSCRSTERGQPLGVISNLYHTQLARTPNHNFSTSRKGSSPHPFREHIFVLPRAFYLPMLCGTDTHEEPYFLFFLSVAASALSAGLRRRLPILHSHLVFPSTGTFQTLLTTLAESTALLGRVVGLTLNRWSTTGPGTSGLPTLILFLS